MNNSRVRNWVIAAAVIGAAYPLPGQSPDTSMVKPRQLSEMKVTATSRGAGGFVRYCSSCHGVEGRGDGLNAFNIKTSPRDFTDTAAMRSKSVSSIQHVIQTGGAVNGLSRDMPPWGKTLDSSSITDLGEYVWGLVIGSSASTTKE